VNSDSYKENIKRACNVVFDDTVSRAPEMLINCCAAVCHYLLLIAILLPLIV
jgi:hypothetical protein